VRGGPAAPRSGDREAKRQEHARTVELGGLRWHLEVMGRGPALLLLHGTGASSHSFHALMPLLARHFTVVAPDLPGHGASRAPRRFVPSLPAMAAAVAELLEALELSPRVAVGHSAGAAVAARMTLDGSLSPSLLVGLAAALVPFRGVTRAVFLPAAKLLSRSAVAARFLALQAREVERIERLVRSTGSTLDAAGLERYRRLSMRPGHVAAVLAMMAAWDLEPLHAELPGLPARLLLLAGEHDRAVPLAQQRAVAARTPGARLMVVKGTGHLLHEEQPERVARLILDELDRPGRPRPRR